MAEKRPVKHRHRHDPSKNLVGFIVGDVHYAVPIARVREIVNPLEVVALPHAPRGGRRRRRLPRRGRARSSICACASACPPQSRAGKRSGSSSTWPGALVALVVDAVTEVFGTGGAELRPTPLARRRRRRARDRRRHQPRRRARLRARHGAASRELTEPLAAQASIGPAAACDPLRCPAGAPRERSVDRHSLARSSRREPEARRVAVQQIAKVQGREAPELLLARARRRRLARAQGGDARRVRRSSAAEEVVAALVAALEDTREHRAPQRRGRGARRDRAGRGRRDASRRSVRSTPTGASSRSRCSAGSPTRAAPPRSRGRSRTRTRTCASRRRRRSATPASPARSRASSRPRRSPRRSRRPIRSSRSPRSTRWRGSRPGSRGASFEPYVERSPAPPVRHRGRRRIARAGRRARAGGGHGRHLADHRA